MLRIEVDDYGPLIAGEVELKPLTVFVGPSNSGKSYMATVVYSLMNAVRESPASPFQSIYPQFGSATPTRVRGWSLEPLSLGPDGSIPPHLLGALESWISSINDADVELSSGPTFFKQVVDSAVVTAIEGIGERLRYELIRNHGPLREIVRTTAHNPTFQIRMQSDAPSLSLALGLSATGTELDMVDREFDASGSILEGEHLKFLLNRTELPRSSGRERLNEQLMLSDMINYASASAFFEVFGSLPLRSYYLPAARSGITQGHKAIAGTLIRQTQFAGLLPVEISPLPGVVRDFIGNMLIMQPSLRDPRVSHEAPTSVLAPVVAFLENNVVNGTVDIEEVGETLNPEIYYAPNDGSSRFPYYRTSSMVTELAPLVLFLKHNIREGNLVILEEPESHLHPASQRQMARAIVRLVNAGVKVLLTTHSDLFLGALNNLMRLNTVGQRKLGQLGFSDEDRLDPADVAAYQFLIDRGQFGSRIQRLDIRNDTGIDEREFSSVVEQLYDESIALQRMQVEP